MQKKLSISSLLRWNRRGLIPAPAETTAAYLQRVACASQHPPTSLQRWQRITQRTCDFAIDWITPRDSSRHLWPWEAAATWPPDAPTKLPQLHLQPWLQQCRWIDRHQVLAHEAVHLARIAFPDSPFEELLAYSLWPSPLRRYWGPLLPSAWAGALLLTPFLAGFSPLVALSILLCLAFFSGRLAYRHWQLGRARRALCSLTGNPNTCQALLLRLSYQEIVRFANSTPQQIHAYAQKQRCQLRWRLLWAAYLEHSRSLRKAPST